MNFYQGFDVLRVRFVPDNSLFSSRTKEWIGEGPRGVRFEAPTLRELKKKIAEYHSERRSK